MWVSSVDIIVREGFCSISKLELFSRVYIFLIAVWELYTHTYSNLPQVRAAPGGWTKYLFRPGVVERIYSIDPGKLSHAVVPGLDADNNKNNKRSTNIIKYMNTTIQKAIPLLVSELKEYNTGSTTHRRKYLDIWVSDMCVKEMSQQLDYFLLARQEGIIGKDTFFVITIKCYVGCSAASFEKQTKEQVQRLLTPIAPLARNVQVIHLFFNRNSERTIIGYLN